MKHLMTYKVFEIDGYGWVCSVRYYVGTDPIITTELSYYDCPMKALKAGIRYFNKVK